MRGNDRWRTMRTMFHRLTSLVLPTLVLLALPVLPILGCSDDPVTIASYNGGLAPGFVPYAEERAPHIMADFPAAELDVICAQEFWEQRYWDQFTSSVTGTHPHAFRRPNEMEMGGTASCAAGDLDALSSCLESMCPDATPDTLVSCAQENCGTEIGGLPDDCLTCVIANIALGDIDMIRAECESGAGGSYAYDSSFGTGIVSRYAFAETDSLLLESTATRRAVLYARIPDSPQGEIHFFCTHLTSNLSMVPYTGPYAGWPEEQAAQIEALLAYMETKTGGTGQMVLAGDLNNGPTLPGIVGELEDNYALWAAAGLRDPYASQSDAVCTFCDDNPLNLGTMGGEGGLIDHVLISDSVAGGRGYRFLDGSITIDVDGMSLDTAYSDHYGFALTIGE